MTYETFVKVNRKKKQSEQIKKLPQKCDFLDKQLKFQHVLSLCTNIFCDQANHLSFQQSLLMYSLI